MRTDLKFDSLVLFLGVLAIVTAIVEPAVFGEVSVKPLSVKLTASAGEIDTAKLNIHNRAEVATKVRLRSADWWRTPDGNLQILPPDSRKKSSADWIIFSPSKFELGGNERAEVTLEASVPEGVSGDHWSMVLITEEPVGQEDKAGMQVSVGYAVKILVEDPNNRKKSAKITNIELVSEEPLRLQINYLNTGASYMKTKGTLEIRNLQGETEREVKIKEFPTLPGEKRIINVSIDDERESLDPGQYYAIVIMDYGGDHLIQGGRPINISENSKKQGG